MSCRRLYTPCKLFYDGARDLKTGDYLRTPGGSAYLVQTVRQNRNRPHRKHLGCLRWPPDDIPAGARIHPLYWYLRKAKTKTLRGIHRDRREKEKT